MNTTSNTVLKTYLSATGATVPLGGDWSRVRWEVGLLTAEEARGEYQARGFEAVVLTAAEGCGWSCWVRAPKDVA